MRARAFSPTARSVRRWSSIRRRIAGTTRAGAASRCRDRFPILDETRWRDVLDVVRERLLTPCGLLTLDPAHREYHPRYEGDLRTRDAAYHQGLVWTWLIGHFVDAWLLVYGDRATARGFLAAIGDHLSDAGMGTISEIFDAEAPHVARGCIAQAWSVAEVLRAILGTEGPTE
ncbi:MAG: hypothetical protein HYU41_08995 [Candidatus Rokubacteria bacterium]|nr:hypothetical protein [Candidatus Rokubacteria bacterium]